MHGPDIAARDVSHLRKRDASGSGYSNCSRAAVAQVVERSPEKAGVGGSTPSRGTIKSTTYKPQNPKTCSNLYQNSNAGPAQVCLSNTSVEAAVHDFASFLKIHFSNNLTADPRAFKKIVLRLVRRELPPKRGRPNDPQIDAAFRLVQQGRTVKEVLRLQIPRFDRLDTYGRYLAEKGIRAAIARRRAHSKQRPVRGEQADQGSGSMSKMRTGEGWVDGIPPWVVCDRRDARRRDDNRGRRGEASRLRGAGGGRVGG